jgi:hypothetical protein
MGIRLLSGTTAVKKWARFGWGVVGGIFVLHYIQLNCVVGWLMDERKIRAMCTDVVEGKYDSSEVEKLVQPYGYAVEIMKPAKRRQEFDLVVRIGSPSRLWGFNYWGSPFNSGDVRYRNGVPISYIIHTNP